MSNASFSTILVPLFIFLANFQQSKFFKKTHNSRSSAEEPASAPNPNSAHPKNRLTSREPASPTMTTTISALSCAPVSTLAVTPIGLDRRRHCTSRKFPKKSRPNPPESGSAERFLSADAETEFSNCDCDDFDSTMMLNAC